MYRLTFTATADTRTCPRAATGETWCTYTYASTDALVADLVALNWLDAPEPLTNELLVRLSADGDTVAVTKV